MDGTPQASSSSRSYGNSLLQEQAGASQKLPPGTEQWMRCPYDKNHYMPSRTFPTHLENCRRVDKKKKLEKGIPIEVFACKYCNELCYQPELLLHESRCGKRDAIRSYQLNIGPLVGKVNLGGCANIEDYEDDEFEMNDMFDGVEIGVIRGANLYGDGIKVKDILARMGISKPDSDDEKPQGGKEKKQEGKHQKKEGGKQEKKPDKKKSQSEDKPEETSVHDEVEDEEWWNRPPTGPGFSLFKHLPNRLPSP